MKRDEAIKIRLSSELKADLQAIADRDRRTLSNLCEVVLEEWTRSVSDSNPVSAKTNIEMQETARLAAIAAVRQVLKKK